MFATTQNRISMILGVALLAGAAFQTSAFAAETTLASNERAAQSAIVGETEIRTAVPADASSRSEASPSIARAEALAQRVILDVSTPAPQSGASIGEATLSHNEIAAQRSIVDATVSDGTERHAATAKTVATTLSPATP
jgi:hypothetical protein